MLATFNEAARRWRIAPGVYEFSAGFDVTRRELTAKVMLDGAERPP